MSSAWSTTVQCPSDGEVCAIARCLSLKCLSATDCRYTLRRCWKEVHAVESPDRVRACGRFGRGAFVWRHPSSLLWVGPQVPSRRLAERAHGTETWNIDGY